MLRYLSYLPLIQEFVDDNDKNYRSKYSFPHASESHVFGFTKHEMTISPAIYSR